MSASDPIRQLYDSALDDARRATATSPDDAVRLDAVFERVRRSRAAQAQDKERSRPRPWHLAFGGLATAAAAAALVLVIRAPTDATPPIPTTPRAPLTAQVMLYSGAVTAEGAGGPQALDAASLLEPRRDIVLPERARVDVSFGAVARMTLRGPARFTVSDDKAPVVAAGNAAFSVERRPKDDPFALRAGDAEVIVHGTEFALAVEGGALRALSVREGVVEVRWPERPERPVRLLRAGESLEPSADDTIASMFDFERPWWDSARDGSSGLLSVRSAPPGAAVTIGGLLIGETPLSVRWPVGTLDVEVEQGGYETWREDAEVKSGEETEVDASLIALPALPVQSEEPAETTEARPRADLWKLARAALAKRQCAKVENVAQRLVRQTANVDQKAQASVLVAECHLRNGQKARALKQFKAVEERFADAATAEAALFEAGKLAMELGQGGEASRLLERYRERYPAGRFIEAADFRRCELLIGQQQLAQARACLEGFTAAHPTSRRTREGLLILATIARGEKDWSAADKLYRRYLALEQEPARAEKALFQRIQCLRQGSLPGLPEALTEYLTRFPDGPHAADVKKWQR